MKIDAGLLPTLTNLFDHALGLLPGQRLLVVVEPDQSFYRDDLGTVVAHAATARGVRVTPWVQGPVSGPEAFPQDLADAIAAADHTVFFSRVGIQSRFLPLPGKGTKSVAYTLDAPSFGSLFGRLPYGFVETIRTRLVDRIATASHYQIRCRRGTDLSMDISEGLLEKPILAPFTVQNFPSMIFPPVSAKALRGTLALSMALLPTEVHEYDDPILPLDSPLLLEIDGGKITGFGGEAEQANRAQEHFDRVGRIVGGDPRAVNSWHTGIHPATSFSGTALGDLERWGSVAFGSPRYTHFHLVGSEPGDICGSLFDATIDFDGQRLWEEGRFVFLEAPENRDLVEKFGVDLTLLRTPFPVGF